MNFSLYIGPSMGAGVFALVMVIFGIVVMSLGYIVWLRVKKFLKK